VSNSPRVNRRRLPLLLAGALVAAALTPTLAAPRASGRLALAGHVPGWAVTTADAGDADPTAPMQLQVLLPWRDAAGALRTAAAVSDPAHPDFGRHLSAAEFRRRHAPTAATVAAVQSWLRSAGLELGQLPANRVVVPARGTVAQVERLVTADVRQYRVGRSVLRAPASAPRVPAALAALGIEVRGLDDGHLLLQPGAYEEDPPPALPEEPPTPADTTPPTAIAYGAPCSSHHGQVADRKVPRLGRHPIAAVSCQTTHTALRAAYGVDRLLAQRVDGRGETVVMVGSHAIKPLRRDIDTWSTRRKIPALGPSQLKQVSYPGAYQTPNADPVLRHPVWAVQSATLLETVHATAPGADLVYVGTTSSFDLANGTLLAVDGEFGDVVINGWYSATENQSQPNVTLISRIAQQAAATGISLLFASGDLGDNTRSGGTESAVYPANEPMATAVGATSLILGPGGRYVREVAWGKTQWQLEDGEWTEDLPTTYRGSGGGISKVHAQPAYQKGVVPAALADRGNGTAGRAVPDLAVMGDAETAMLIGYTMRFPDGKDRYAERRVASGTASTALVAALIALANDRLNRNLGFVNPQLYALSRTKGAFRDVVAWGGAGAGVRVDYVSGVSGPTKKVLKVFEEYGENVPRRGYDTATGLGSPAPALLTLLK
jgi:subtilase family serine protease